MADDPQPPMVQTPILQPASQPAPPTPAPRSLRAFTAARIGLPRAGDAIATAAQLDFQLDHAAARDAVHAELDAPALLDRLQQIAWPTLPLLQSACARAHTTSRRLYLERPDLGRRLSDSSAELLRSTAAPLTPIPVLAILLVDGLSARAIERHALPFLEAFAALSPPPAILGIVRDGRVAIGDEIGHILGAALTVVLIGERPGLTAPESMGLYLTWAPRPGRTDAERNCISNIHPGGLSYSEAALRLCALLTQAKALAGTGVAFTAGRALPA